MKHFCIKFLWVLLFVAGNTTLLQAQQPDKILNREKLESTTPQQYDRNGRAIRPSNNAGNDSLKRRDSNIDSITIFYRYFDSSNIRTLDSSITNLYRRLPMPDTYINLGNYGTAARSLLFNPITKPGFDAGFHSYDLYRFTKEDTRFFQTTRPYTELGYMLGSKSEQMVNIIHTQNIKPNFNMAFQYRFINSPGTFKNQNTSHNNFRINGNYQSRNKRYTAYGIFLSNKLTSAENGGIRNDSLIDDDRFTDRFNILTRLGTDISQGRNFFTTRIDVGNIYTESLFFFRQQYDVGQKDSLAINDSTTIQLFYPRLRFQHSLTYNKEQYTFQDFSNFSAKQTNYLTYFNQPIIPDSIQYRDKWRKIVNDLSIISFPEKQNLNQFLKAGIAVENLSATFGKTNRYFHNIFLSGEYRNRTRNKKWYIEAAGNFYLSGLNAGDYSAQVYLKRYLSKKLGSFEAGFLNVNRTPSYNYNFESDFPVLKTNTFSKENVTRLRALLDNPALGFTLSGNYYLVSNYSYFSNYFAATQESTLFNVLQISASKKFRLLRTVHLYSDLHVQQTTGNPPVNLPLILSSNRVVYEDNLFKNLFLATGVEVKYHTPYKADNYSPFNSQFMYQDTTTINNRPQVNLFFNFRIKSFSAFVRLENVNTLGTNTGAIGFTRNNKSLNHYYQQALWFRLGIWWIFVN